jgi:ferritin-like metal-binding protein YciE
MEFFINELERSALGRTRISRRRLPEMANAATSAELKYAFEFHLTETETHVSRLEQVFAILGLEPESRTCEAMSGILDEGDEIISITDEGTAQRDVGLIFAGQKSEHYEIASYGGMIALAKTLRLLRYSGTAGADFGRGKDRRCETDRDRRKPGELRCQYRNG